jgi:hypothetical protein
VRILMTANFVAVRTGSELYVAELATELQRRGHDVAVYAPALGELARQLRMTGVQIVRRPGDLPAEPEVIHGQGPLAVAAALDRFPTVPALVVCHGHTERFSRRVLHAPSVRRFAGVSRVCVQALLEQGAPRERTSLQLNFVDTDRFRVRPPLPPKPARALMFSNYAREDSYVELVRAACTEQHVQLDVVGTGMGNSHHDPPTLLPRYDVVFAKGRAALEAAAVGCAVVLCDFAGLGPMVTPDNFDQLRPMNFGFEALTAPHTVAGVRHRLQQYAPVASAAVAKRLRAEGSLRAYVSDLEVSLTAMADEGCAPTAPVALHRRLLTGMRLAVMGWFWSLSPESQRRVRRPVNVVRSRVFPPGRSLRVP